MKNIKLEGIKRVHFVGVGGIGASSLAQILLSKGKTVSGSDLTESQITDELQKKGMEFSNVHAEQNLNKETDLLIYSHAIPQSNIELQKARDLKIPTLTYPEALSILSKSYFTIAISGTHGKSTTTAMTALILEKAGLDPTVVIGTKVREFGDKNYRVGEGKYLVIEACEYKSSFLDLTPQILAITNIEAEHLDYFKTDENYYNNFQQLINSLEEECTLISNPHDEKSKEIMSNANAKPINAPNSIGFKISIPGSFNEENASIALAISRKLGIDEEVAKAALESYEGSWRRMERKTVDNIESQFIDDYAHHPTEIRATLKAIRESNPDAKILCIFQPHQYSRTHNLIDDFAESFEDADQVYIPNIYEVRDSEEDKNKVSSRKLVNEINKHSNNAQHTNNLVKTAERIKENADEFDIIITMGAGDITSIYNLL